MRRKGLLPTHLAQLGSTPCQRQCSGLGGGFLGRGVLNPTPLLFSCSVMSDSATPGTVARQASLPMGIPRQEYRSGLPFPSPGDLPDPGIKPASSILAGGFFTSESPGKPYRSFLMLRVCMASVLSWRTGLCTLLKGV